MTKVTRHGEAVIFQGQRKIVMPLNYETIPQRKDQEPIEEYKARIKEAVIDEFSRFAHVHGFPSDGITHIEWKTSDGYYDPPLTPPYAG